MSRYIDADALIEELQRCSYETWSKGVNRTWWAQAVNVKDNIVQCIERQPTADVVEVVRCKDCTDCEHCYPRKDKGGEAIEGYYCYYHKRWVTASYHCGDGKRREG